MVYYCFNHIISIRLWQFKHGKEVSICLNGKILKGRFSSNCLISGGNIGEYDCYEFISQSFGWSMSDCNVMFRGGNQSIGPPLAPVSKDSTHLDVSIGVSSKSVCVSRIWGSTISGQLSTARLKAKLCKLKRDLLEPSGGGRAYLQVPDFKPAWGTPLMDGATWQFAHWKVSQVVPGGRLFLVSLCLWFAGGGKCAGFEVQKAKWSKDWEFESLRTSWRWRLISDSLYGLNSPNLPLHRGTCRCRKLEMRALDLLAFLQSGSLPCSQLLPAYSLGLREESCGPLKNQCSRSDWS